MWIDGGLAIWVSSVVGLASVVGLSSVVEIKFHHKLLPDIISVSEDIRISNSWKLRNL